MKKNIRLKTLSTLALALTIASCADMLNPTLERNDEISDIAADTLYSYWGILQGLQHLGERYIILGECRGEMVGATSYVSDSIHAIMDYEQSASTVDGSNRFLNIRDFYLVINECNSYIMQCDTSRVNGTNKSVMSKEYAQIVSIRAWVYLQMLLIYGEVPYVDTPMLSTAAIEEYLANQTLVNAENFTDKDVVKKLIEVRNTPAVNYGSYGRTTLICDASLCVFPQNLVLGDIYLLKAKKGDVASYQQAARYYYDYLNTQYGGCINPTSYYGTLIRNRQTEVVQLGGMENWLDPFKTTTHVAAKQETVTVIPSSTNKLWGYVQRGVNELFGYTTDIKVATGSDTTTTATIKLELEYEHQLGKSAAYDSLNAMQTYECYLGNEGAEICTPIVDGKDARYFMTLSNHTKEGQDAQTTFVQKQNPAASFSTAYPVIYRKASIWLRYAEALNGAGYPGYAFAVLKSGLCGNSTWLPTMESQYTATDWNYRYLPSDQKDTLVYTRAQRADWVVRVKDSLTVYIDTLGRVPQQADTIAFLTEHADSIPVAFSEMFDESNDVVCYFIPKREMLNAKSEPALNFSTLYLRGVASQQDYVYGATQYEMNKTTSYPTSAGDNITIGIHARGCGMIKYDERNTTFNYVDQINRMRELYGATPEEKTPLTKEEIYDAANLEKVQFAVANLLTDELGLETAFEGNRFFDLVCLARATGRNTSLADRVAQRNGTKNAALHSRLMDSKNWYFQCP